MLAGTAEAQEQIARIADMDQRLDDEFQQLARERPELAEAILDFQAKEREYEEAARGRRD
jgi:hypothetical protein